MKVLRWVIIFWLVIWMAGCDSLPELEPGGVRLPNLPTRTDELLETALPVAEEDLVVYFTDPAARWENSTIENALVRAIDAAETSVDVAAYSFSLESLGDALLKAHQRGVRVRVVMESDNMDGIIPAGLEAGGIPVVGDQRNGLMHHKFIVIDGAELWTGSMNLTGAALSRDHNHLARVLSREMALDFSAEFEEMFTRKQFGAYSAADTPYPSISLDGSTIEVLFSPDDGVQRRLVELLREADTSIYFLAYSFTADPLAEALIERSGAGVLVAGVVDSDQYRSNEGSDYDLLRAAGIDARLDANPGLMHHKVFVIDEQIVVFGSYNFSRSAEERNDENVLIAHDPALAGEFMEEFQRIYAAAEP